MGTVKQVQHTVIKLMAQTLITYQNTIISFTKNTGPMIHYTTYIPRELIEQGNMK